MALLIGSDLVGTHSVDSLVFESFPKQVLEIADVSLIEGTIGRCNYLIFFTSPRNRTQEADGHDPVQLHDFIGGFLSNSVSGNV
jgi:hypothetical protein